MTPRLPVVSRRAFIAATAILAAGCLGGGPAGRLRLAAGDPGGLYLAFAELLAGQIRARFPAVTVDVVPTEGSVENLALLRAGEVDLGLALADAAERDRATQATRTEPFAVARVYENYLQVIVRDSDAAQRVSDLGGRRVSIGPEGSGTAATSRTLLEAAGLIGRVESLHYRLKDALDGLADRRIDALVWSGGVPTPAIADLDDREPLRTLDVSPLAGPMSAISGYTYALHRVPTCRYVPSGVRSIGVPNLLLCRTDTDPTLTAAVVDVLATDAAHLVPPDVRGLQYLDTPSMIQTGLIPLHPGALTAYRALHG